MSNRTPNRLSLEQEIIVRDFYEQVVQKEELFADSMKTRQIVGSAVLRLLGYTISAGRIVPEGEPVKWTYGQPVPADDHLYDVDGAAARQEFTDVSTGSDSTDEAGPSESPEGDEVGDVLQQDV